MTVYKKLTDLINFYSEVIRSLVPIKSIGDESNTESISTAATQSMVWLIKVIAVLEVLRKQVKTQSHSVIIPIEKEEPESIDYISLGLDPSMIIKSDIKQ